jgi:glycosyltransferase 2 family protein
VLRTLLLLAILGVALYFIVPNVVHSRGAFQRMTQGNYGLLALAVLLEVCAFMGYSLLTRSVFHSLRADLSLWLVLRIVLAGFAASRIFSVGGIGGFVVTYKALARRGVSRSIAVVAVATQQFFNYIVLWMIFFIALLYLAASGKGSIGGVTFALVCIGLILGNLTYYVYLYHHPTRLRRRARQFARALNALRRRTVIELSSIDEWVDNLRAGIRPMAAKRGAVRTNVLCAVLWWGFDISCLICVFRAYGYTPHLSWVLMAYSVAYTVATFVPTPGGLGTVEAILLGMFAGFGVPSKEAVASVLVYRLINFWLPIPFGTVAYLTVRRGGGSPDEEEAEA